MYTHPQVLCQEPGVLRGAMITEHLGEVPRGVLAADTACWPMRPRKGHPGGEPGRAQWRWQTRTSISVYSSLKEVEKKAHNDGKTLIA